MEIGDAMVAITDKLGIAATEVVEINSRYIAAAAVVQTIVILAITIGTVGVFIYLIKKFKKDVDENENSGKPMEDYPHPYCMGWDMEGVVLASAMLSVLALFVITIIVGSIGSTYLHVTFIKTNV